MPITVPVRVRSSAPVGLGDAEVGDLHRPAARHQHVGGLHVAVHEAGAVRGVERVGDLLADADHVGDRAGRPCSSMRWRSVRAVDQLHHDVGDAVVVAGVVGRHDVRVDEPRRGDRLVAEPGAGRVVGGEVGAQDLHRDPARQHRVVGDPHRGHPAPGERLDELVAAAEHTAGRGQFHGVIRVPAADAPGQPSTT